MSKKILWVSRHMPGTKHLADLGRIHGDSIEFFYLSKTLKSSNEILAAFRRQHCDDMVVVAPDSMILDLSAKGYKPLRIVTKWVPEGEPEFRHFERILKAEIITEPFTGKNLTGLGNVLWLSHILPTEHEVSKLHFLLNGNLKVFNISDASTPFDEIVKYVRANNIHIIISRIRLWRLNKLYSMLPDTVFVLEDVRTTKGEKFDLQDKRGINFSLRRFIVIKQITLDVEKILFE